MRILADDERQVSCPRCGVQLQGSMEEFESLAKCPACGAKLTAQIVAGKKCRGCSRYYPPEYEACPHCGKPRRKGLCEAIGDAVGDAFAVFVVLALIVWLFRGCQS